MSNEVICQVGDLVANSGVCARIAYKGESKQVALFYLPDSEQKIFALDNWDPLGEANVLSRGMVGDINSELVVASPLYKQHFSLVTGQCLESDVSVQCYQVAIDGDSVVLTGQCRIEAALLADFSIDYDYSCEYFKRPHKDVSYGLLLLIHISKAS